MPGGRVPLSITFNSSTKRVPTLLGLFCLLLLPRARCAAGGFVLLHRLLLAWAFS